MKPRIYEQHDAAFKNVAAYVVLKDCQRVATIAFKFPKDGAGRLFAYVHWFNCPMTRGYAGGYGYDKRSAACASAVRNGKPDFDQAAQTPEIASDANARALGDFRLAMLTDNGTTWDRQLERAGFKVLQAV